MKKLVSLLTTVIILSSCADSKTFEKADGTKFVAQPDEMEEADWDELWEKTEEADYYSFYIEEFEGDEEEWEDYGGEVYGEN